MDEFLQPITPSHSTDEMKRSYPNHLKRTENGFSRISDPFDVSLKVGINAVSKEHVEINVETADSQATKGLKKFKTESICCVCKDNEVGDWVGCDNECYCISYLHRMVTLAVEGGDWFHVQCVNLTRAMRPKENGFVPNVHLSLKIYF